MVTLVCKLHGHAATTDQDKKKRVLELVKRWIMEPVLHQYTMTFRDWLDHIWTQPQMLVWPGLVWPTSCDVEASGSDATLPMPGRVTILPHNGDDPWAESSQDS